MSTFYLMYFNGNTTTQFVRKLPFWYRENHMAIKYHANQADWQILQEATGEKLSKLYL